MGGAGALGFCLGNPDRFASALVVAPALYEGLPPSDSTIRASGAFGRDGERFVDAVYVAADPLARLTAAGLYERRRSGHFWHRFSFATLAEFDRWREGTRRFPRYEGDRLPRGGITVRRAIAFIEYRRP